MKKNCIIFLLSIIITLTAFGFVCPQTTQTAHGEYLRMHVRADSNESFAQAVKYTVKDGIVAYLTPLIAECETRGETLEMLSSKIEEIKRQAEGILRANGYAYGARVSLKEEKFPTRVYEGVTLPAGEYTALIVELGKGQGDNWWCVVYPPLCFVSGQSNGTNTIVFRSKLLEIINEWKANNN